MSAEGVDLKRRRFLTATASVVGGVGVVAVAVPFISSMEPSARAQAATIKIGMCAPVTGPAAESGGYAIKGAKLALEAVNKAGGILGKQAELIIEDDQTTNPGIVLAFSKLAAQSDIVAFLGSIRSTQVHAMAPDVLKLGKPVMIGGTDPNLTHMGNQWIFRFRPNDNYSGRVIADYGVNTLGKKKWAVLHSTDPALGADERIDAWAEAHVERVERARTTVRAALDREVVDLATLSVALRVLRALPT